MITAPPIAPVVLSDIAAVKPYAILAKPFDVAALADAVHGICRRPRGVPGHRALHEPALRVHADPDNGQPPESDPV